MTREYGAAHTTQVQALSRSVEVAQSGHDEIDRDMEAKFEELRELMKRKQKSVGDMTRQTSDFASEDQACLESYCDALHGRVEAIGKSSATHHTEVTTQSATDCNAATNYISQVIIP
jgi:hypothetical protein